MPPPLATTALRTLTLRPEQHPRGQPHVSAASGLVCAFGRAYVMADDEHHLAIFDDVISPGRLHRVLPGDLPHEASARKRRKADLETLTLVPAQHWPGATGQPAGPRPAALLLALGSGSAPQRDRGLLQPLDGIGHPMGHPLAFDLAPLYEPLRARLGALNIEGAVWMGREGLCLLNRGGGGERGANAVATYGWGSFAALWSGQAAQRLPPQRLREVMLGSVHGVGLGFTDGVAWPAGARHGGEILFTAVAEDSADSVADGACVGSVVGSLGTDGTVHWVRSLAGAPKVEGVDARALPGATELCLSTDADDPARPSSLLVARL